MARSLHVLDRNLAVQACRGKPLPKQVLAFDKNDGAGFWWANSLNSFTGNVACECDEFGYRFDMVKTADFDPYCQFAGRTAAIALSMPARCLFIRFEDNDPTASAVTDSIWAGSTATKEVE